MKPRTLHLDIETTPHVAEVWGKYEQDVISFIKYSHLLSYSAKWSDSNKIISRGLCDFRDKTDRSLVKELWDLMDEAEIVVAHNGNAFDVKRIMARFTLYGMKPPSPFRQIDTKLIAKKYFSFPSNSLNDIADFLGIGRKKETGGIELWHGCIAGDKASWKKMLEYNANDVILLEKVYLRMLPFITNHPNQGMFYGKEVCTNCGHDKLQARGTALTLTATYHRLQCNKCGHWQRSTEKIVNQKTLRNVG